MAQGRPFTQLVVVGSSAGGIDALSRLVAGLPSDFAAPIVVAQHIDPNRASHLREILARRTELRVVTVEAVEALEAGVLYVVPANRNVEISNYSVEVGRDQRSGPMPSVDLLLRTAARAFGENLIAVILSGAGSDGAAGARAVKVAGGAVIVQDPQTAGFPSMPSSVAPTTVDVVATADAMGPLLVDLLSGTFRKGQPDDDETMRLLLDQLREQSGIDFERYKRPTIVRRLERRMAAVGVGTLRDYLNYMDVHPEEYQRLVSAFLIKVTEFFRDEELFGSLRTRILPELIADARAAGRRELRIWSAGCATGEEAYSVAMIVADTLGEEIERWTVRIFATDVDEDAIAFARRGTYPGATVESLPAGIVERHFTKLDGSYIVQKNIRGLTVFGQHDLALRAPFPRVDLVLCRNVMIYFTPELQRRALQLFAFSLREGGVLVLGKAEATTRLATAFVLEDAAVKVYRRHGERIVVPPHTEPLPAPAPKPRPARAVRRQPLAPPIDEIDALQRLPIGIVEVDSSYDIRTINMVARSLLGIRGIAVGRDFVHLARSLPSQELRNGLDEALAGRMWAETFLVPSQDVESTERRKVRIEIRSARIAAESRGGAVVIVDDISETATPETRAEDERRAGLSVTENLEEHVLRLAATNRSLVADNEELAVSNVGLRAENEQLLVSAEEAQATAEEVETLNEELQATNEELETLNEELQATNEELNTTNDDMEARQRELELLTTSLANQQRMADEERGQLAAILAGLRDAIVVFDDAGEIMLQNEAYGRLTDPDEPVLMDADDQPVSIRDDLRERARRGDAFTGQFRNVDAAGGRRWYEVYGEPVTVDEERRGGVLVIRDITERSLRQLQSEFVAMVAHELRTPLTALRGYLQLLGRNLPRAGESDGAPTRYSGLAMEQAERLQQLIADLFETARVESGALRYAFAEIDLGPFVAEAVEVARTLSDRHAIELSGPSSQIVVSADPVRLQQVILNVLANAVTHAPNASRIDVSVGEEQSQAMVRIADHGPGIRPEDLPTLFSRYRQGTRGAGVGLGLGLFISREIVTAHGGTIAAAETAGGGTTITIALPEIVRPETNAAIGATRRRRQRTAPT